jgi:glycosyltransferase involved in cell wall biosynthesis
VLLCVAMFRPGKNQGELIEIAAGLPPDLDWQLWLAGDGPTRAACVRLAAENNLSARVKFPGWQRDPGPLYSAADIAVHASSRESLSNFLIEAQAHGLPVVAAEAQGITECFLPGETGFAIPPRDHAAFRSALVRLAHAPADRRATCAARSRAHALATFDPQQQIATYLGLLQKLSAPSS